MATFKVAPLALQGVLPVPLFTPKVGGKVSKETLDPMGRLAIVNMPHSGHVVLDGRPLPSEAARWADDRQLVWLVPVPAGKHRVEVIAPDGTSHAFSAAVPVAGTFTLEWPLPVPVAPTVPGFDAFVQRCPTDVEIATILRDFPVENRTGSPLVFQCATGSDLTTVGLTYINLFRFFAWVRFRANLLPWPIPFTTVSAGATPSVDLYGWLRGLGLRWHLAPASQVRAIAIGGGIDITFNADNFATPDYRYGSLIDLAAVLIHEVRHTIPGGSFGHPCASAAMERAAQASGGRFNARNTCDPTLSWGGAYNAEYYFWQMIVDHAEPGQFRDDARPVFADRMREILTMKICDPSR